MLFIVSNVVLFLSFIINLEPWTKLKSGDKHTVDWKMSDGYFLPGKEILSCAVTVLSHNRRYWDPGVSMRHKGNGHVRNTFIPTVLATNSHKHVEEFLKI